jgi:chromate transporter
LSKSLWTSSSPPQGQKPASKKWFSLAIGAAVVALSLSGVDEIVLLLGGGVAGLAWAASRRLNFPTTILCSLVVLPFVFFPAGQSAVTSPATLTGLGLYFLKVGSVLYGSGYVLLAFLQGGLVDAHHWLTRSQLLDAVAVGQFTPGPLSSTATFVGYLILGVPGAAVATAGIFLPSFVFVLLSAPFIPRLRSSALASGFLDGVNGASLGLMTSVCVTLALAALTSPAAWIIFVLAAAVLVVWNVHPAWVILGSAVAGWLVSFFAG